MDLPTALNEMRRVLPPGGRLVIDDRSVPEDDDLDTLLNELDTLHDRSHVRQYRADEWGALLEQAGFAVETVEVYTRHRPLTSLTEGVDPLDVQRIEKLVEAMPPGRQAALNLERRGGMVYFDHYYIILAATAKGELK